MPEYPIRDSILTSLNAQEPWPNNVKLFQPYEVEQILLPDNASCLAVQAFLKMCNLPFEVEMRWNAEFMSPSGRVPFIKCGAFVVSELEPIAQFAANKGVSLCNELSTEEKAEMRAYMSLITNVLVNAELYVSWIDNDTFNQVTKVRNSSVYPWPLGWLQTRSKRNAVTKRLKALHWYDKTLDQVLADVEQCCNSLSQRLGDKEYFFGTPTQLDALLYGHIRALLSARGPKAAVMIRPISYSLLLFVERVAILVDMELTPQEQYLLRQASMVRLYSTRSVVSNRSSRMSRLSKISLRRSMGDNNLFGFKPFASKKIVLTTLKDGCVTCKYDKKFESDYIPEEEYYLVIDIIEDIMDKVEEIALENMQKIDKNRCFEVIAFPDRVCDSQNGSLLDDDCTLSKDLDVDRSISFENTYEDVIHVINEDPDRDSDLDDDRKEFIMPDINSPLIGDIDISQLNHPNKADSLSTDWTESSKNRFTEKSTIVTPSSSGCDKDVVSLKNESLGNSSSKLSIDTVSAKQSVPELNVPLDEESSVEHLLTYLKERTAVPTELDALVFGHVFTIITTRLPCRRLAEIVRKYDALVALAKRVDEQYFKRP